MKLIRKYKSGGVLLLATLFSAAPTFAVAPVVITCAEYHKEDAPWQRNGVECPTVTGEIEAVLDMENSRWILTATPTDSAWMFVRWSDGVTDQTRYLSVTDLDAEGTYTAEFAAWYYDNCYSPEEYTLDQTKAVNDTGKIVVTRDGDEFWTLTAVAETDYTFAQWTDGSYVNPRTFAPSSADKDTIFATFIPDVTKGNIDFWRTDGLVITTEEGDDLEGGDYGAVTVFYDGQLMSSHLPSYDDDIDIEPRVDFGVYYLPATYSSEYAGKTCHLVFKDNRCNPVATLDAVIPVLVTEETDVDVTGFEERTGVHVLNGGVATLSGTQTVGELDIYPGGKAIIDGTIEVDAVTMRADAMTCLNENGPDANVYQMPHPELLVTSSGRLNNEDAQIINYDYAINLRAFYTFGLPYIVNTHDVTYRSGADACNNFVIGQYYGDARAAGGSGWDKYNSYYDHVGGGGYNYTGDVDINHGVGHYIYAEPQVWDEEPQEDYGAVIRFPMEVDLSAGPESVRPIQVYTHDSENKEDKNFNLISIPYLTSYDGSFTLSSGGSPVLDEEGNPKTLRYIVAPNPFFKDYDIQMVGTVPVYPFHAYFVQFDGDVDELELESPNPAARASAPRRSKAKATTKKELMAGITLSQSGKSDHTGLLIGEHFTEGYDVDADFVMMMGESERVRVFSLQGNKQLTYIALPPANGSGVLETTIPLGYSHAVAGSEMTFAIDDYRYPQLREDEDISALYLIDNKEGVTVNLLEEPYTCTAIQAADNERFSLGIRYTYKAPQITTDICATPAETNMRDGIYDLLGRLISTDTHISHPGVYIVIENGKARKEVIR